MVTHDSNKRNRIRQVIKDCVEDLEERIERVSEDKSLEAPEKSDVYRVIQDAKKVLLDGHNELMAKYLPTEEPEE